MTIEITFSYKLGDKIECRDPTSGSWRPAWVERLAPYRGRPGYYIQWEPLPKNSWESSGGWTYEACMRPRPAQP